MERREFIFNKEFPRTHSFCTAAPETFVLIHAEGLKDKKYKVYGGSYTENTARELTAKQDYELFVPGPDERLVSFALGYAAEIRSMIFIGTLEDLFLVEFFLTNRKYNRSGFQYTKRELTYSEQNGKTFLGIYLTDGAYKVSIATNVPYQIRKDIFYKPGTNAFRLIEWFFQQMKIDPPTNQHQGSGELDKLLPKYFPAKSYKQPDTSLQGVYRHR
ncbi:MAG: hypothetical protein K0S33_3799 [Bacteroidetes bacterium]|jgi:hypothetical protein|nr:hypothetical protein [Bacteroidota bacterium]